MRGMCLWLLPLLALEPPASAGVVVREAQGKIDVAAAAAPLADILDRLARQTGMKVVYEGPAPRQLVTLSLVGRSPAEAVSAILEGQGLNYALILDATATRVEQLLVTGAASASASGSARSNAPRYTPPPPEPEPEEPPEEPVVVEPPPPPVPEKPQPPQPQPSSLAAPNGPPLPPGMTTVPPGLPVFPTNPALVAPGAPAPQPTPTPVPAPP